jgi:hypothetical protein
MGLHKTKKLLHRKVNGHQTGHKTTKWEKIFASYTFDKGLITRQGAHKTNLSKNQQPTE